MGGSDKCTRSYGGLLHGWSDESTTSNKLKLAPPAPRRIGCLRKWVRAGRNLPHVGKWPKSKKAAFGGLQIGDLRYDGVTASAGRSNSSRREAGRKGGRRRRMRARR